MTQDYFNAASAASQLIGSLEGTRNFHWHSSGNIREALRINDVMIDTLSKYSWSRSSDKWLEQYKQDQVQLKTLINESESVKANP